MVLCPWWCCRAPRGEASAAAAPAEAAPGEARRTPRGGTEGAAGDGCDGCWGWGPVPWGPLVGWGVMRWGVMRLGGGEEWLLILLMLMIIDLLMADGFKEMLGQMRLLAVSLLDTVNVGEDVLQGVEVQRAALEDRVHRRRSPSPGPHRWLQAGLVGNDAAERRAVAWASKPPAAWQAGWNFSDQLVVG
eukprot:Skav222716  [mRNA]  locus=scaffold1661:333090:336590:- [translate_table: standard]